MAGSPNWKVYDEAGVYRASCKDATLAACLVALLGNGATIRWQHRKICYTEGVDGCAANSYDEAADIAIYNRNKPVWEAG